MPNRIARLRSITYDCLALTRDTSSALDRCGNAKTAVKSRGRQDGTRKVRKPGGSDRGIIGREREGERGQREESERSYKQIHEEIHEGSKGISLLSSISLTFATLEFPGECK